MTWRSAALGFFALSAVAACGQSSSDDDGVGGTSGAGSDCASDFDCKAPAQPNCAYSGKCVAVQACDRDTDCTDLYRPKCSQAGECLREAECGTDADCRGNQKRCDTTNNCQTCLTDADCSGETPACVQHWESGTYCDACRAGDSSYCPAGAWCSPLYGELGGGTCEAPNCDADPSGKPCVACKNENAPACLGDGGECSEALATFHACYAAELPGWAEGDCPTGTVPSIRGCTPEACFDEADAFDACLLGCAAVAELCGG